MGTTTLLPPEEEFEGQFRGQQYERNKALNLDRIFNFMAYHHERGIDTKIAMISVNHIIVYPLNKDGQTLDVRLNTDDWCEIYRKRIFTKSGRKWLEKNWVLPTPSNTIDDCSLGKHLI